MKTNVGVFFGGKSVEHDISIISALHTIKHINRDKYNVIPIYVAQDNHMYTGEKILDIKSYNDFSGIIEVSERVILVSEGNTAAIIRYPFNLISSPVGHIEVGFPLIHGTYGEDGTLQGYLKMLNIPFVGSDIMASSIGMDKLITKAVLRDSGIPVLNCKSYQAMDFRKNRTSVIESIEKHFSYPVIVKPSNIGSSVGITVAYERNHLINAIEVAISYSMKVLVEPYIQDFTEISCAVLGDCSEALTSECEEFQPEHGTIYTYEKKYLQYNKIPRYISAVSAQTSEHLVPTSICPDVKQEIKAIAVKAFQALNCSGVARVDFIIDRYTSKIFVNEINTIPAMCSYNLWEKTGIAYHTLVNRLIELAQTQSNLNKNIRYSCDYTSIITPDLVGI